MARGRGTRAASRSRKVMGSSTAVEEIEFYNPFADLDDVNAIYLARA